jgi:hypothetical protein
VSSNPSKPFTFAARSPGVELLEGLAIASTCANSASLPPKPTSTTCAFGRIWSCCAVLTTASATSCCVK